MLFTSFRHVSFPVVVQEGPRSWKRCEDCGTRRIQSTCFESQIPKIPKIPKITKIPKIEARNSHGSVRVTEADTFFLGGTVALK